MKKSLILGAVGFILFWGIHPLFSKRIYIVVDNARLRQSLISFPPFKNLDENHTAKELGDQINRIARDDLEFSGLFSFIDPRDLSLWDKKGYELSDIDFKEWASLGTEFLIAGGYRSSGDSLTLDARLYDIASAKMVFGKKYIAQEKDVRALAHRFTDAVMEELTGDKGIFQTKVLFVSNKTKHKELYVMDYDGKNIQQLTFHKSIVFSPAWSPDGKKISYSTYTTHEHNIKNLDLFVLDLTTGDQKVISRRSGLNSGASWAPNGKDIALTLSYEGDPDIYLINASGENVRKVTSHPALDVEPAWSSDGQKIIFSSGRAPLAHLYVMNKNGEEVNRLTFAGRFNSSPAWSPKGEKIVFAGDLGGYFDLFLINPNGTGLQRLTKSQNRENNEHPSWSADGRHIVFSSNRSKKYELYMINDDGSNERALLKNYGNITYPAWSPYLE
ncbi:MAG: Tol-Pal system beta propeller repeat protein TolB [Deltaproteobacteria bacterium]|nr:Tol-Pal system beta propeller repeat protein TolB [Deltaproteobacteria bacterium]